MARYRLKWKYGELSGWQDRTEKWDCPFTEVLRQVGLAMTDTFIERNPADKVDIYFVKCEETGYTVNEDHFMCTVYFGESVSAYGRCR